MSQPKTWTKTTGIWYGIHPEEIQRVLVHFSQYNKSRLHKLRISFINLCAAGDWRINTLKVKGFLIDNLDGGYKYGINYYDRNHRKRLTIYGPLRAHHYKYLKKKSFFGGKPLDKQADV